MATKLPSESQQAAADAVVDRTDQGTTNTNGLLRIYDGTQPSDADSAPNGTLLVEFDLADPAFGAADATGTADLLGTPLSATASAAGTAQSMRVVNKNTNTVADGAVRAQADPDNGEELVLDNTSIANGQTVKVNSLTYTQPPNE